MSLLPVLAELTGRPRLRWADVVVMRNVGHLRSTIVSPDHRAARGMHLVVLDDGVPRTYVKCRPLGGSGELEAQRLGRLAEHLTTRDLVPTSLAAEEHGVHLLAMEFVPGVRMNYRVQEHPGEFAGLATRTLRGVQAMRSVLGTDQEGQVLLTEALAPALPTLRSAGIPEAALDRLTSILDSIGPLPRQVQHGDLAPWNVIIRDDRMVILDFELFGEIEVPLFDAWHLGRMLAGSLPESRRSRKGGRPWWEGAAAGVVREPAAALNLNEDQVRGCLLWYLATFVHILERRGNPPRRVTGEARTLTRLLDELAP